MKFFRWLFGRFSNRGKAMSLYKRGMAKSRNHQHQDAIDDYTAVIAMPRIPADIKAMALFNRALVAAASEDAPGAIRDLNAILAMDQDLTHVKTEARRKLVRMQRGSDRAQKALET